MPSRAKTTMKRKRRNNKLMMDFIELSSDTTRFLKEFQYLHTQVYDKLCDIMAKPELQAQGQTFMMTHLVTLKILSSLRARRTLIPNEAPGLMAAQITSKILPIITCGHSLMNAAARHSYNLQLTFRQHMLTRKTVTWLNSELNTYPKVKTVEWGVEVVLGSKAIHLHGHLCQKQTQEYKLGQVCPRTNRKHTDQCPRLERDSPLISTVQYSWVTAAYSAEPSANKTQESLMFDVRTAVLSHDRVWGVCLLIYVYQMCHKTICMYLCRYAGWPWR